MIYPIEEFIEEKYNFAIYSARLLNNKIYCDCRVSSLPRGKLIYFKLDTLIIHSEIRDDLYNLEIELRKIQSKFRVKKCMLKKKFYSEILRHFFCSDIANYILNFIKWSG